MPKEYSQKHDKYMSNYQRTGKKKVIGKSRLARGLKKDGTIFPLELGVSDVCIGNKQIFVGTIKDYTERQKKEDYISLVSKIQEMYINNLSLADIFEEILNFMITYTESDYGFIGGIYEDGKGRFLKTYAISNIAWDEASKNFYEDNKESGLEFRNLNSLFGYTITTGKSLSTDDAPNHPRATGVPHGHPTLQTYLGMPIKGAGGETIGMYGLANRIGGYCQAVIDDLSKLVNVMASIIESSRSISVIEDLANKDPLSNAYNRNYLNNYLLQKVTNIYTDNIGLDFAVLMIDCNGFKKINDFYGHDYGDHVIVEIVKRMKSTIKNTDIIARVGGDEFILVINDVHNEEDIIRIAKRISKVCNKEYYFNKKAFTVTVGIGISIYEKGMDTGDLLKNVDLALYKSKNESLEYYLFSKDLKEKFAIEQRIEKFIIKAFEEDLFYFYYQPQINLKNTKVMGFEALLRCKMPGNTYFSIQELVNYIRKMGLSEKLNKYAVYRIVKDIEKTALQGIKFSINVSPYVKDFVKHLTEIADVIDKSSLSNETFALEFVEDAFGKVMTIEQNNKISQMLTEKNISLAIDDFGVEYSSVNRLIDYEVDILKIDRSFIRNINQDDKKMVVVKAIIGIAKSLGIKTVAEGIEYQEHEDTLKKLGCDYGQGYLYSKPIPLSEALNMIILPHMSGLRGKHSATSLLELTS